MQFLLEKCPCKISLSNAVQNGFLEGVKKWTISSALKNS
jgi:hypothetical protein